MQEEVTRIFSPKGLPTRLGCRTAGCCGNRLKAASRPPESSVGRCIGQAKNDLLLEAQFTIATIEQAGYPPVVLGVLRDIRLEQVQRHATHLYLPNPCISRPPGKVEGYVKRVVLGIHYWRHRQPGEIVHWVGFLLPAIRIEVLLKITALVP
jgi:hypothetical protein